MIAAFLRSCIDNGFMPGAAWWIEGPEGPIDRGAIGNAVIEPAVEPVSERTPYDVASLTKTLVTSPLLVLLDQQRRLELDAPVELYLPEVSRAFFARTSLRSLALHTAGLPAWRPLFLEGSTLADYVSEIARMVPAVEPGRTLYSDPGYILLGAVLERVSGERLDRLFRREIGVPLGLDRTGFAVKPASFADAAGTENGNLYERRMAGDAGRGHPWREQPIRGQVHDANAHGVGEVGGHAGLFGPPRELARLAGELLRPRLLPLTPPARAALFEVDPNADGRTVGMVAARSSSAARGILPHDAPGHTGFTGCSLWFEPRRGRFYLLLTNRVHPVVRQRNFQLVRRGFHRLSRIRGTRDSG